MIVVFSLKKSVARSRKEPERCSVLSFISHLEFSRVGGGGGIQRNHKHCYYFTDSYLIYGGKSPIPWPLSGNGNLILQKM